MQKIQCIFIGLFVFEMKIKGQCPPQTRMQRKEKDKIKRVKRKPKYLKPPTQTPNKKK
jgi:hypothetical protein